MKTDVLIVGTGCAGLYAALKLPRERKITLITKSDVESCDSFLAQGGICVLKDPKDYDSYFDDTMKAGHYENDTKSVEIMIKSSPQVIQDVIDCGAEFAKNKDGAFDYTREGGHAHHRILYHNDVTGKEITSHLLEAVKKLDNVKILENTTLLDIIEKDNTCYGAVIKKASGKLEKVEADYVMLATGGVGGLYRHSTNFRHLTGDGVAIAIKHDIKLKNVNYVQIHPTTFYSKDPEDRSFLISESVRGEGAYLLDKDNKRFVNELLPRDVVSAAIFEQMKHDSTEHVWEDLRPIPKKELHEHFPNICEKCAEKGYDVDKECIPVVPAQHYYMGGIWVDHESKTSMDRLYAIGETACNGVHGKNRLASNSLLESMVFAGHAAEQISANYKKPVKKLQKEILDAADLAEFEDQDKLAKKYKKLILDAMKAQDKADAEREKTKGYHMFDPNTLTLNVDPLIKLALQEDITSEDVTTNSVMPLATPGVVDLICKEDGIVCGLQVFERVFTLLDPETKTDFYVTDGDKVEKGQLLAKVHGDIRVLLSGERVALNYLQRMSGIATYTSQVASLLEGTKIQLLDTRKTCPNMRIFEKYAVRIGGGHNHRYNLSDGVLLKDNHIGAAGGVKEAILAAKAYAPFVRKIEVEVETFEQVKEAVEAGANIIMLDNMTHEQEKEAIEYINGRAEIEISGNVTKENIEKLKDLNVDFVSSGALTHSAPILDLSLKNLRPEV